MKLYKYSIVLIFGMLLAACKKEGTLLMEPVSAYKPFSMVGYIMGDTLEQYFDGKKVRDFYGLAQFTGKIAFQGESTEMELRKKSTGEVMYKQTYYAANEDNIMPKFFFDGQSMAERYTYRDVEPGKYLSNFYFDTQFGTDPVDLIVEVQEYYFDWSKDDPFVYFDPVTVPLFSGLKPGQWSEYLEIPPIEELVMPQHPSEYYFNTQVFVKNARTGEFYAAKKDLSWFILAFPMQGSSEGRIQSFHITLKKNGIWQNYLSTRDLVQFFPR